MNNNARKVFTLTSYYRSIIGGIGGVCFILWCFWGIVRGLDSYPHAEGTIIKSHLRWEEKPFAVKLSSNDKQWYRTYAEKYYSVLNKKANLGKHARIWYNKKHNIKQLVIDNEVIIPFRKRYGIYIIFLIISVVYTGFNLVYLLKNPQHAKGKNTRIIK